MIKFKTAGAMQHDINQLPHAVYYSTEEEQLLTGFQIWMAWYNSDDFKEYNGDFMSWYHDIEAFDLLRPCEACTVIWVKTLNGETPLLIDAWATEEMATKDAEAWRWFYDDGFPAGSMPMSVINFDTCTDQTRDWLADPANAYTAPFWNEFIYGGIPTDLFLV